MFRQGIVQCVLPVVVLVGLGVAASARADPEDPRSLAKQRLTVAQEANDAIKAMRKTRENASAEQVYRWSRRLMEAEIATSEKKADQIAAVNAYLLRMKEMEKLAKEGYHQGEVGYLELLDAKWHVLEAESLLSQAKRESIKRLREEPASESEGTVHSADKHEDRALYSSLPDDLSLSDDLRERTALMISSNASIQEFADRYEITAAPWRSTIALIDGKLPSRAHDEPDTRNSGHKHGHSQDGLTTGLRISHTREDPNLRSLPLTWKDWGPTLCSCRHVRPGMRVSCDKRNYQTQIVPAPQLRLTFPISSLPRCRSCAT